MQIIILFFALALFVCPVKMNGQGYNGRVSVEAKYQVHQKGNLYTIESESLYDGTRGRIISHYLSPVEFFKTVNKLGEISIYMPRENQVTFTQNSQYGSNNELLYYFVNNLTQDLGLASEGFLRSGSRQDGDYFISEWTAPAGLQPVHKVELVFENFLPVYAVYLALDGKPLKKIYYYEYHFDNHFALPLKITEITYVAPADSVVRRTTFSNIRTGYNLDDSRFNFEIPDNATKVDL